MSVECQNIYRMKEVQLSLSSSETTFQKSNHKHKNTENLNFCIVPDFLWKCQAGTFTKMSSGTGRDSKRQVLVKPLNRCLLPRLKSERHVIIQNSASINSFVSISHSALDMQNMPNLRKQTTIKITITCIRLQGRLTKARQGNTTSEMIQTLNKL